jgi:hypothetical protein
VFYGLGCFSFHEGHREVFDDWLGLAVRLSVEDGRAVAATCLPVRHTALNETVIGSAAAEGAEIDKVIEGSRALGTELAVRGDALVVWQRASTGPSGQAAG